MTREFRVKLLQKNRDEASTTIRTTSDESAIREARQFARTNGISSPPAVIIPRPGHRGLYAEALTKQSTGFILSEIFA